MLPNPPEGALTATRDVVVIPPNDDERLGGRISFVLGEASEFDLEHGYYAQGVTSKTPRFAPANWMSRAVPVRLAGAFAPFITQFVDEGPSLCSQALLCQFMQ